MSSNLAPQSPYEQSVSESQNEITRLAERVTALETRFPTTSWVFGPSFIKRAFAMWAHVFVAGLIIAVIFYAGIFACAAVFGFGGLLAGLGSR